MVSIIVRGVIARRRLVAGCYFGVRLVRIHFGKNIHFHAIPLLFLETVCWKQRVDCSEDCLPEGDVESVGPTLPEFEVLGYGENKQAFYIRCPDCVRIFRAPEDEEERGWVKGWEEEFAAAEKQGEVEKVVERVERKVEERKETGRQEYEMVDLTADSPVKMEISRSTATTVTTKPEEYESDDLYTVVRDLHPGREVIIID